MKERPCLILVRAIFVLLFSAISVSAFQSNLGKPQTIAKCSSGWGTYMLPIAKEPTPKTFSLFAPPSRLGVQDKRRVNFEACRSVALQYYHISKSSALFLTSSSAPIGSAEEGKKRGFFARLRWLLLFPWRFLILNPLKYVAELVVDDLDDDGTVAVAEDLVVKTEMATSVNTTEVSSSTPLASVAVDQDSQVDERMKTSSILQEESEIDVETAVSESAAPTKSQTTSPSTKIKAATTPMGTRWAVAASGIDLTGDWDVIVTDEFRTEYDRYLDNLGQPLLVRTVAVGIIGQTNEETQQTDHGKSLLIRGKNLRGIWDRTLVSSGTDVGIDEYTPLCIPVMTADSEKVEAESWWEDEGTVHVSWLRGVSKYGGGSFESRRYLDDGGDTYVCDSTFHPDDAMKEPNSITWRFRQQRKEAA